jgi:hypothetical protein
MRYLYSTALVPLRVRGLNVCACSLWHRPRFSVVCALRCCTTCDRRKYSMRRSCSTRLRTGLPLQVLENTAALSRLLDVSNLVLTALFAAEMVLKLYALGFREYLRYEEVS